MADQAHLERRIRLQALDDVGEALGALRGRPALRCRRQVVLETHVEAVERADGWDDGRLTARLEADRRLRIGFADLLERGRTTQPRSLIGVSERPERRLALGLGQRVLELLGAGRDRGRGAHPLSCSHFTYQPPPLRTTLHPVIPAGSPPCRGNLGGWFSSHQSRSGSRASRRTTAALPTLRWS